MIIISKNNLINKLMMLGILISNVLIFWLVINIKNIYNLKINQNYQVQIYGIICCFLFSIIFNIIDTYIIPKIENYTQYYNNLHLLNHYFKITFIIRSVVFLYICFS